METENDYKDLKCTNTRGKHNASVGKYQNIRQLDSDSINHTFTDFSSCSPTGKKTFRKVLNPQEHNSENKCEDITAIQNSSKINRRNLKYQLRGGITKQYGRIINAGQRKIQQYKGVGCKQMNGSMLPQVGTMQLTDYTSNGIIGKKKSPNKLLDKKVVRIEDF